MLRFLICTNSARVRNWPSLIQEIQVRIPTIIWASWKVWPWVAVVNFIWVPVGWRVLVTSLVGLGLEHLFQGLIDEGEAMYDEILGLNERNAIV